jgi:hypothetical protein
MASARIVFRLCAVCLGVATLLPAPGRAAEAADTEPPPVAPPPPDAAVPPLVAAEPPPAAAQPQHPVKEASVTRYDFTFVVGNAWLKRSAPSSDPNNPESANAKTVGVEIQVHPYTSTGHSPHGGLIGLTVVPGNGANLDAIVDLDYSLEILGPRQLKGVTGALYTAIGPFYATLPGIDSSSLLGGRISLAGDLQINDFTIGVGADYRLGVTLNGVSGQLENIVRVLARVGVVFDVER